MANNNTVLCAKNKTRRTTTTESEFHVGVIEMPSEAKVPTYDKLMWPVLNAIKALGGSATNDELLEKVVELENIPDAVQNVMQTQHQTKLGYRIAWAKTYLGKAGALENPTHGVWAITESGKALTAEDADKIPAEVKKLYKKDEGNRPKDHKDLEDPSPELKDWKDELLAVLTSQLKPDAFERLAQRILRESKFIKVEVTGSSGDGGIDGVGVLRLALLSFQVRFQCKRYKGSVSPSEIRDFRGAMVGRADKGLFITTGTFTAEAKKEATRDGAPAIDLIDGDALCDLLKDLKLGVATKTVEEVSIDPSWFAKI